MITRQSKGSELTYEEMDANFLEALSHADSVKLLAVTEANTYTDTAVSNAVSFKVVDTLPPASLSLFEKSRYDLSANIEYICIANTSTPTTDAECFWVQR